MMLAWALIIGGSVLALPQIVTGTPWQAGLAGGLLMVFAGVFGIAERGQH